MAGHRDRSVSFYFSLAVEGIRLKAFSRRIIATITVSVLSPLVGISLRVKQLFALRNLLVTIATRD